MTALPTRRGPRPRTQRHLPHSQLDQQPERAEVRRELARRCFSLPGVVEAPSGISVPGARALVLRSGRPGDGADGAFLVDAEFAHLHPDPDLSLHLALPEPLARAAVEAGWAEWHFLVDQGALPPTVVLAYAPRDGDELEVVWRLVQASHRFAAGTPAACSHLDHG